MPTNITTIPAAVFTDETLNTAAELTAAAYRPVWTGPSGEQSTGEDVARHLEATITLLDKDGWSPTLCQRADSPTAENPADGDDESMTVKEMLRSLLRVVRAEFSATCPQTLSLALCRIGMDGIDGDTDTDYVARSVLDLIIRAHTGSDSASATAWSERQHRTHPDITTLLTAAARFARTYGPEVRAAA